MSSYDSHRTTSRAKMAPQIPIMPSIIAQQPNSSVKTSFYETKKTIKKSYF
jgi:hypothetical protein